MEWLRTMSPSTCTEIMLQQCDREALMALLFLGTGLQPSNRIPLCLARSWSHEVKP